MGTTPARITRSLSHGRRWANYHVGPFCVAQFFLGNPGGKEADAIFIAALRTSGDFTVKELD